MSSPASATSSLDWAALPPDISRLFLEDLPKHLGRDLRSLTKDAALQYRRRDGRVWLRASASADFIYAKSLTSASGGLRHDVESRLTDGALPFADAAANVEYFGLAGLRSSRKLDVGTHAEVQYRLLTLSDPLPLLGELAEQGYRLFRIGANMSAYSRLRILDFLDDYASGRQPRYGPNKSTGTTVTGNWSTGPGPFACFPLLCHLQPMVMLVRTANGAEVAILPPSGSGFERVLSFSAWPVGHVGGGIHRPGKGLYKASNLWKDDVPLSLLIECVAGANALFQHLSSPQNWLVNSNEFDTVERWIAWASVTQGVDALTTLAIDWTGPSSIWEAFRALTILQGIWQGTNQASVKLEQLLLPDRLREQVLPRLRPQPYQLWAADIIKNWESQLHLGFPNLSIEEAASVVEDLRNLVHGVGAPRTRRAGRLTALRLIEEHKPGLQLVADVATLWWTALLLDPSSCCVPGRSPWSQ